jgi:BRCT domain type II-containing protein
LGSRGRWISEFEASLVYSLSSRTSRVIQRNPVSEKQTNEQHQKKKIQINTIIMSREISQDTKEIQKPIRI